MLSEGQSFEGLNSRLKYISKADTSVFTSGSYFAVIYSQNDIIATYVYNKPASTKNVLSNNPSLGNIVSSIIIS